MAKKVKPKKTRIDAIPDELIARALIKNRGLQYLTADDVGLSGASITKRIQSSPYLQEVVHHCQQKRLDKAEINLSKLVEEDNNLGAICFLLKTLGKSRGYIEQVQQVLSTKEQDENLKTVLTLIDNLQSRPKIADKSSNSEQKS